MNNMFVYVYKPEDKNKLLSAGYKLIKEDLRNHLYVFENKAHNFNLPDMSPLFGNTLSF